MCRELMGGCQNGSRKINQDIIVVVYVRDDNSFSNGFGSGGKKFIDQGDIQELKF